MQMQETEVSVRKSAIDGHFFTEQSVEEGAAIIWTRISPEGDSVTDYLIDTGSIVFDVGAEDLGTAPLPKERVSLLRDLMSRAAILSTPQ